MDFETRELKFGVNDKSRFNAEALLKALKSQGFPNATVTSPSS
jgi:hypothetical protein